MTLNRFLPNKYPTDDEDSETEQDYWLGPASDEDNKQGSRVARERAGVCVCVCVRDSTHVLNCSSNLQTHENAQPGHETQECNKRSTYPYLSLAAPASPPQNA